MVSPTTSERKTSSTSSFWNVPFRRNSFFTGREKSLTDLHTTLEKMHTAALSQPVAMSGLGGVGKTQVAVEYAYRHREDYQAILWVSASNAEEVLEEFAKLAQVLHLPEQKAQKQQQTIQAVKLWLETHTNWLLIFDNADELITLYDYLPQENIEYILLTTRAQTMSGMAQKIEIEPMESEEGKLLLLRRAEKISAGTPFSEASEADRQSAQTIFGLMGGLPLALDQAGAYIEETKESLSNYIDLFQQRRATLLKHRGGRISFKLGAQDKASSDHLPVATTWSMAFKKIQDTNPAAIEMISLCAFLTPDAIPEELLIENASSFDPAFPSRITNRETFNTTVALLLDYSLLSREPSSRTVSMHRLIQAVIKDDMTEERQIYWSEAVIEKVSLMFPFNEPAPWPKSLRYILHGLLAVEYINQWNIASEQAMVLLNNMGVYYYRRGQYREAEELYQRALAAQERLLGAEHPDTLNSVNNLATLYWTQGKYEQAGELYQRALSSSEKALGPEHPSTSRIRQNYADFQQKMQKNEMTPSLDNDSKKP